MFAFYSKTRICGYLYSAVSWHKPQNNFFSKLSLYSKLNIIKATTCLKQTIYSYVSLTKRLSNSYQLIQYKLPTFRINLQAPFDFERTSSARYFCYQIQQKLQVPPLKLHRRYAHQILTEIFTFYFK
jgi:hypothetical protein